MNTCLCQRCEKLIKAQSQNENNSICKVSFEDIVGRHLPHRIHSFRVSTEWLNKISPNSSRLILQLSLIRWEKRGADENANTLDCPQFLLRTCSNNVNEQQQHVLCDFSVLGFAYRLTLIGGDCTQCERHKNTAISSASPVNHIAL